MTPDDLQRLGLEQVGRYLDDPHYDDDVIWHAGHGMRDGEPVYRVADPAALAEALAERDALRADNQRLREALERIAQEPAPGYTLSCRNIARAALSATQEADNG